LIDSLNPAFLDVGRKVVSRKADCASNFEERKQSLLLEAPHGGYRGFKELCYLQEGQKLRRRIKVRRVTVKEQYAACGPNRNAITLRQVA